MMPTCYKRLSNITPTGPIRKVNLSIPCSFNWTKSKAQAIWVSGGIRIIQPKNKIFAF